ncbi:hypothetical protein DPMN_143075 [Dreissena polymorpha]|uniref:Uncharacterized protein n=1 Tax=Dreissena polymorpha TaxID=45954 RepID=A0A9D4GFJ9_DREPO|nr:hypothetical protein DPMN_143075 [Dreissena polymorpha]
MQFCEAHVSKQLSDLNYRIKKRLLKYDEDELCAMPLSMMDPSLDARLHKFYVNPGITDVCKKTNTPVQRLTLCGQRNRYFYAGRTRCRENFIKRETYAKLVSGT